jgi:hypothetical protein
MFKSLGDLIKESCFYMIPFRVFDFAESCDPRQGLERADFRTSRLQVSIFLCISSQSSRSSGRVNLCIE